MDPLGKKGWEMENLNLNRNLSRDRDREVHVNFVLSPRRQLYLGCIGRRIRKPFFLPGSVCVPQLERRGSHLHFPEWRGGEIAICKRTCDVSQAFN